MRITVSELEAGSVFRSAFSEHVASDSDDVSFEEPVVGTIEATRTGTAVLVKGQIGTTTTLVCGRCLDPFRHHIEATFREEFIFGAPAAVTKTSSEGVDTAESLSPTGQLDVSELVREHLLLAVPMVPLCTPTCRGLCPQCGANWNQTTCTCSQSTIDPRLAPLQQFKPSPRPTGKKPEGHPKGSESKGPLGK
jgi:uncharacterized protein